MFHMWPLSSAAALTTVPPCLPLVLPLLDNLRSKLFPFCPTLKISLTHLANLLERFICFGVTTVDALFHCISFHLVVTKPGNVAAQEETGSGCKPSCCERDFLMLPQQLFYN